MLAPSWAINGDVRFRYMVGIVFASFWRASVALKVMRRMKEQDPDLDERVAVVIEQPLAGPRRDRGTDRQE